MNHVQTAELDTLDSTGVSDKHGSVWVGHTEVCMLEKVSACILAFYYYHVSGYGMFGHVMVSLNSKLQAEERKI